MPAKEIFADEDQTKEMPGDLMVEEIMINFFTPNIPGAGTNARVKFEIGDRKYLIGDKATSNNNVEQSSSNHFEQGQNDTIFFKNVTMPLADLRASLIKFSQDGTGLASDWNVSRFEMQVRFADSNNFKVYKIWPPIEWVTKNQEVVLQKS